MKKKTDALYSVKMFKAAAINKSNASWVCSVWYWQNKWRGCFTHFLHFSWIEDFFDTWTLRLAREPLVNVSHIHLLICVFAQSYPQPWEKAGISFTDLIWDHCGLIHPFDYLHMFIYTLEGPTWQADAHQCLLVPIWIQFSKIGFHQQHKQCTRTSPNAPISTWSYMLKGLRWLLSSSTHMAWECAVPLRAKKVLRNCFPHSFSLCWEEKRGAS